MCGICCVLPLCSNAGYTTNKLPQPLKEVLQNRGPDINHKITLENNIVFHGFVLWQQGSYPSKQPLETNRFILLFNGDVFRATKDESMSDTSWLINELDKCENEKEMLHLLTTLEGPYSIIVYNKEIECIYFARDPLGRNSLILERDVDCLRILSSTYMSHHSKAFELPSLGVYKLCTSSPIAATLYPWKDLTEGQMESVQIVSTLLGAELQMDLSLSVQWSAQERREFVYNFSDVIRNSPQVENLFEHLLTHKEISATVEKLKIMIQQSIKDRIRTSTRFCKNCIKTFLSERTNELDCQHAKIGILFSGGIDCTIIAAIANEYVSPSEPIDLINVAFEPVRKSSGCVDFKVPDRISAMDSFSELQRLFPERQWNLVEVDVTRDEIAEAMRGRISNLIHPLETVLDESLGCAFWFASRGIGTSRGEFYSSTPRVILVGSGADELFGGYVRHRNAFTRCKGSVDEKIKALDDELGLDWKRIPTRNLGRDDRVIADNGRTSRAPFIEENLVQFVTQLHPLEICCFDLEQGTGDKLLLRLVGYSLGLRAASLLKKRAIQFGSRIADKNQNAKEISIYLVKNFEEQS